MLDDGVMGYRRRTMKNGLSPFELLYGVKARILPAVLSITLKATIDSYREVELLSLLGARAAWAADQVRKADENRKESSRFQIEDAV